MLLPLTPDAIRKHLTGKQTLGIYPLLPDETCWFLAVDFDKKSWMAVVDHLKTDGSAAPVPLGELLADALRGWHQQTPYAQPEDWIFPSSKLKGITPLSASIMAKDKSRPARINAGIRPAPGR